MTIQKTQNGNNTIFALEGRLDTTTAPELQEVLISELSGGISAELDFEKLVYVSSAGLRVLLMGEKTAKSKGCKLTISHVSPDVLEVFEMTGFSNMLTLV